jgi:uncharacterized secreted protein with C-terminal beta-propeller domain
VTGSVADIGHGESIKSVLFVQDRAFVVTFLQVDPLFAIDLSDPANPQSMGELVTPGFATYLYAVDTNHLIGVGRSPGSDLWHNGGVQVTLYDVSDLAHPVVTDQKIYPGSNSAWGSADSAAIYDPHAFSYFAEDGVLAIPLDTWGDTNPSVYTLEVLKVDPASGFTGLGEVTHDSQVQRSLRIDGKLYSLAQGDLKVVDLLNPAHVIADVTLPGSPVVNPPVLVGLPIVLQPILRLDPIDTRIINLPGGIFQSQIRLDTVV